jgi:hypothetical protein
MAASRRIDVESPASCSGTTLCPWGDMMGANHPEIDWGSSLVWREVYFAILPGCKKMVDEAVITCLELWIKLTQATRTIPQEGQ